MAKSPRVERLSGLQSEQDRQEALEVMVEGFSGLPRMVRSRYSGPLAEGAHTRVVVAKGRVVSAMVMSPRRLQFGPVTVPAMTIGPLATHVRFRHRGYAEKLITDATCHMREEGYLLAYLGAIPSFYHRFGYYPFRVQSRATLKCKSAEKVSLPGRLLTMKRAHLPSVQAIYKRANEGRMCAAKRDDVIWNWLLGSGLGTPQFRNPKIITGPDGPIHGHATGQFKNIVRADEFVVDPSEESVRLALGALAALRRKQGG